MTELKNTRWVKVHEQGQANHDEKNNVMDIMLGDERCKAEVTYTARSARGFQKAADWMLRYLDAAGATELLGNIPEAIRKAAAEVEKDAAELVADGEGWALKIENMGDGVFKGELTWTVTEPVTKKKPAAKKKATTEEKPKKKRGRKKAAEQKEETTA